MTDRKARDQMTKAIRSYMNEEITAFQFDDALAEVTNATKDETVGVIGKALWFHYDDCKDHKIVASKEEWDYFNRLLLLLESDGDVRIVKTWRMWPPRPAVAGAALSTFIPIAVRVGFGDHLFVYALPSGAVSMVLAWFTSRERERMTTATESALTPFPSIRSLLSVRRSVPDLARTRYPRSVSGRRVRSPVEGKLMWIPWTMLWLMFSPVALFFQMLPERECETGITMPEQVSESHR